MQIMRNKKIKVGSEIDTVTGKLVVTGWNGHIAFVDEYEFDYDTEEEKKTCERMLTLSEIGKEMKEVDGLNHNVIWED